MQHKNAVVLAPTPIPGISHATLASRNSGCSLSVWQQSIDAGLGTPDHRHTCDEVVTVQRGTAAVRIGPEVLQVGAGETVVLPAGIDHQIASVGDEPLQLLAVFGQSPVRTLAPDGSEMQLPWQT
jgi:mannose-6-phosphate isomerase-like protein (cupin superfamily)